MGSRAFGVGAACLAGLWSLASPALAQAQPQSAAPVAEIAAPIDRPYPGVIRLAVDATDLAHAIFAVRETVPVTGPGPITLLYPQWIPGDHRPSGTIDKLAGLIVSANGQRLEWRRDPMNVWAFHIEVPAGVSALDLDFQFLSPVSSREGQVMMTPAALRLNWNNLVLYPAGYFSRDIEVDPSLKLPDGFTAASALEEVSGAAPHAGETVAYKTTPLNTLVDSPVLAGKYFSRIDLDPGGPARVSLNIVADRPDLLAAKPEQIAAHTALVQQAYKTFGSHHYDHYDFLVSLSDKLGGVGLEHHQSSEDQTDPKYFTGWDKTAPGRDLLAHEYTHSWNGKFRRPADLWTPNFNVPMRDSLLWVYEGQTQYWGYVLAARAGLLSKQEALDAIAMTAAQYDTRVGRSWRPLEDATNDPVLSMRRPISWLSWQRDEDYYSEGELVWLDVDTLIREKTGGKKSLDDFARAFFGVENGSFVTKTYSFGDVVAALNGVVVYDWAGFLRQRLEGHGPGAPLDGVARGGYRLVFTDTPTGYFSDLDTELKRTNLMYSIGFTVDSSGSLSEVLWDGPAFKAGLTQETTLVAVNGEAYSSDLLKDAIKAAKGTAVPIALLVKNKDEYRTVLVDYHGGPRYPRFERLAGTPARLDDILTPLK
jgi:predicted metalloprotease with PDZ domain